MKTKYNVNDITELRRMFEDDVEFAEYVSRFASCQRISIDDALEMAIVRERALDYLTRL